MRCLIWSPWVLMSNPRTLPSPDVSCISPNIVFRNVDFPAPFGPSKPVEPFSIRMSSESSATWGPYDLVRALDSIIKSSTMDYTEEGGPLNMPLSGATFSDLYCDSFGEGFKFAWSRL